MSLLALGLAVLIALWLGGVAYVLIRQHTLVFRPIQERYPVLPSDLAPHIERVSLQSSDGVSLAAFAVRSANDPDRDPWLLFLHGNGRHIGTPGRLERYREWRELGVNVLSIDYRGYGESEGEPDELGLYRDATAGYEWLRERRGIPASRIIVMGGSLGSTVAVDLAARVEIAALILEGAITSVLRVGQERFPLLPMKRLMRFHFDALSKIDRVRAPILFLHARQDKTIPIHHGRALFARALHPKTWVELDGGHDDAHTVSQQRYLAAWREFMAQFSLRGRADGRGGAGPEVAT